jgi:small subunit ribosomal protein S15
MLTKRQKTIAVKSVQRHDADTGSPESQVALLSKSIDALTTHLKKNKKDAHSRRGLLQMVADRRRHLMYLKTNNEKAHNSLVKKLGLKK